MKQFLQAIKREVGSFQSHAAEPVVQTERARLRRARGLTGAFWLYERVKTCGAAADSASDRRGTASDCGSRRLRRAGDDVQALRCSLYRGGGWFQSEMQRARAKVREWWGATFEGSISIQTNTERVLSMALIPAWRGERGQMIFGAKRVDAGEAATVHEMIHVYAPNANRFLAEGLAVYGHDLLGGPPAYPNFGKSLDDIAGRSANRELAMTLERTPTPNPLESVSKEGEAIAGSFVKFLIERHGMDKFRALYALTPLAPMQRDPGGPTRWQQVYGESFEVIVDAWLTILPRS